MPDLTAFLLARISEDETMAHEFDWAKPDQHYADNLEVSPEYVTLNISPARVLAECETKRQIINEHRRYVPSVPDEPDTCVSCAYGNGEGRPYPCDTLKLLAAVYADHPEFDPSWQVE